MILLSKYKDFILLSISISFLVAFVVVILTALCLCYAVWTALCEKHSL